jgi:hypothetical protein
MRTTSWHVPHEKEAMHMHNGWMKKGAAVWDLAQLYVHFEARAPRQQPLCLGLSSGTKKEG